MVVLKESEDHFFKHQTDMLLHGMKVVSYRDCLTTFQDTRNYLATQICQQRSPEADQVDSTTLLGNAHQGLCKEEVRRGWN